MSSEAPRGRPMTHEDLVDDVDRIDDKDGVNDEDG